MEVGEFFQGAVLEGFEFFGDAGLNVELELFGAG